MFLLMLAAIAATPEQEYVVANHIVTQLRDPASAYWTNFRINDKGVFCVEINAKNGFGGYAGFTTFRGKIKNGEVRYSYPIPDRIAAAIVCGGDGL